MLFFVGKTSKFFEYTQMYEMDWNKLRIDLNSILFRVRINEHFMYKNWTDIFDSKLQKFTMVIKILTNVLSIDIYRFHT